ncbi:peptidoglycan DD-metalloendopeptidase family protein [bacterium]|nr:peptidoglycan DD-metalloendopeptidase family protein [bacterium]
MFNKIIVKGYCKYNSILKKLGWERRGKRSFLSYLLNENTVHVIVIFLTVMMVIFNLTQYTSANNSMEIGRGAMITGLVKTEFNGLDEAELIEETVNTDSNSRRLKAQAHYIDYGIALNKDATDSMPIETVFDNEINQEALSKNNSGNVVQKRDEIMEYEVKSGDSVSTIAAHFDVSVKTILWENNLSEYGLIRAGDILRVLPQTGVTHKIKSGENLSYLAGKYSIDIDEIAKINNIKNVASLSIGDTLVIPGGEKITTSNNNTKINSTPNYNAISVVKNIVNPKASVPSNKMFWPTEGHTITQYYTWRHHGLDIANKQGTPLYAADAGTIEFVGWSNGYGNNIIINHGGGKKTRYAHLYKFYVKSGQKVDKGQTIGEMGNTGWSTGPHLHFEVIINNQRYNPLNYIK